MPRSSAYRHLTDLHAAGLVRRVTANDEFTRFELAEDLTEHHHHLLCVNCGKVIDVTLPAGFEHDTAAAISQLADTEGFQAHSHRLDVLGLCAGCANRAPPRGALGPCFRPGLPYRWGRAGRSPARTACVSALSQAGSAQQGRCRRPPRTE